ncbi:MAG: universal stress protein [SAR324 cluster bacterium]|nr:universal stress protein [SAR324 cluster bacterium]
MENTILIPLDNTEISEYLIQIADEWGKKTNSRLSFLHVINPDYSWSEDKKPLFEDRFETAVSRYTIQCEYEVLFRVGKPYEKILTAENELRPRLIIMAAHSYTILQRLFLGSNTDHVLHKTKVPLHVYKKVDSELSNVILVPLDYTDINTELVHVADEIAQNEGADLAFLHVDELPEYSGNSYMMETGFFKKQDETAVKELDEQEYDLQILQVKNELNEFVSSLKISSNYQTIVRFGIPYVKIKDVQKSIQAKMIVMAAHSHTVVGRLILGSNTDYLMHHVNCPMYIYKSTSMA